MTTIFTRIIDGEIPAAFVHRDNRCAVFMSINPLARGHALVVPIDEIDHWIDAPPDLVNHLFGVAHRIGRAQHEAFNCARVGLIVAGFEVPHAHIHVIPTQHMGQLSFENAAATADPDDLEAAAQAIRSRLA